MASQLRDSKGEKLLASAPRKNSAKVRVMDQQPWRLGSILQSGPLVLLHFFVPEGTG